MRLSICVLFSLVLIIPNLLADYHYWTVGPDENIYDYVTITAALNEVTEPDDSYLIEVYPEYDPQNPEIPFVTTYWENIQIPKASITLIAVEGPDYTIINSGSNGNSAIWVRSSGYYDPTLYEVVIDGFTIIRENFTPDTENYSGIELYSRNVVINNCKFIPSNVTNCVFNNSISAELDNWKTRFRIVIQNCDFNNSCSDNGYAIKMFLTHPDNVYLSYYAYLRYNTILNCGNGINISQVEVIRVYDNSITNNIDFQYDTCGIEYSQILEQVIPSFIESNTITKFNIGLKSITSAYVVDINNNIFEDNYTSIQVQGIGANIYRNLIFDDDINSNVISIDSDGSPSDGAISFFQNTLVSSGSNSIAIDCNNNSNTFFQDYIYNNIFSGYDDVICNYSGPLVIDYCCMDALTGFEGVGNIINPTIPVFSDPSENDYSLYWNDMNDFSPCINSGHPNPDNDNYDFMNDPDDRDPDHSRLDMGYQPYDLPYDTRYFNKGWNWRSFPMMETQGTDENGWEYQLAVTTNNGLLGSDGNPSIDAFLKLDGQISGVIRSIMYDYVNNEFDGYGYFSNRLYRHDGYKIQRSNESSNFMMIIPDATYDPNHYYDFAGGQKYWVGYPLNTTTRIDEIFNNSPVTDWSNVKQIEAEEWGYFDNSQIRGMTPETKPWGSTPEGKYFEYGQTYIITFYDPVYYFTWEGAPSPGSPKSITFSSPEYFEYTEQSDYEIFEILEVLGEENIIEIGVFENDICVGATVVDSLPTQVLAHTTGDPENPGTITFQVITEGRDIVSETPNYDTFNLNTGEYENDIILSGSDDIHLIRLNFGTLDLVPKKIKRMSNYPNPFNPTTNLSFYSASEQSVDIDIFNIKGQKIKTFNYNPCHIGQNTTVWNGDDENEKHVGSGIYFYRITTDSQKVTRKMMLIK